jgi:hypothetical protein
MPGDQGGPVNEERNQEELGETAQKARDTGSAERKMSRDASRDLVEQEEATGGALPKGRQEKTNKP